jgi:hypothetical protein
VTQGAPDARAARRPLPNFVGFVLTIAMVWLSGQFVTQGLSDYLLSSDPELAVYFRGDSADAVAALARKRLSARNRDGAARLAGRALQLAPLNASALATYGIAKDQLGQPQQADQAMSLAGKLGWRDIVTQLWLLRERLLASDYDAAFDHADALMRRQNVAPRALCLALASAARDPRSIQPLARRLADNPPWRLPFFVFLSAYAQPPETDVARALMVRLASGTAPPTNSELAVYLRRLVSDQRFDEASRDWRLLTRGAGQTGYVYDGAFDRPLGETPFDWTYQDAVGWSAGVTDSPGQGHGQALRVEYDGVSPPQPVRQLLILPAGAYRLSGRSYDDGDADPKVLAWRISCTASDQTLANVPTPGGAGQWNAFSTELVVPPARCPAQWLALVAEPGDVRTDIAVWYDDIAVAPLAAAASGVGETH